MSNKILEYLQTDKDGNERIIGDTIDLGPYEFDPDVVPVVTLIEDVSIDESLTIAIPNLFFGNNTLNISLILELDMSVPDVAALWKLVKQEESTIQIEQPISIDENYRITFPRFFYNNELLSMPITLVPYFNSKDPFVLHWIIGG